MKMTCKRKDDIADYLDFLADKESKRIEMISTQAGKAAVAQYAAGLKEAARIVREVEIEYD